MGIFSPNPPGWPCTTAAVTTRLGDTVRLRPLNRSDREAWSQQRLDDQALLAPYEPTPVRDWETDHSPRSFRSIQRRLIDLADAGELIPTVIEVNGQFAGQLTLGNIQRGVIYGAWIGYWVYSPLTGRGIATTAVALGVDWAFSRVRLHRLEATVMPENPASAHVLETVGFRREGHLLRNIHINGQWRDHDYFGLVVDDYPNTAIARLVAQGRILAAE